MAILFTVDVESFIAPFFIFKSCYVPDNVEEWNDGSESPHRGDFSKST